MLPEMMTSELILTVREGEKERGEGGVGKRGCVMMAALDGEK